jgi:transposase
MIVIGVDVHKQSLTAIAVDEAGRALAESTAPTARELLAWASSLPGERSWAVEDCRQLTRALEAALLAAGESLVRVPPKLMAPQRRAGRARGKSDPIDALAVARAALREPRLDHPRPGEQRLRELKLLVDHRDDLIDERRRAQQRLRWHLHELELEPAVPLGALDRGVWLDRLGRRLAGLEQSAQVRIARELVGRCRGLTRTILALDRELQTAAAQTAPALLALPGCGAVSAAKLLGEIGPIERFETDRSLPATPAWHHSKPAPASIDATGSTAVATANSTAPCTGSRSRRRASTHPLALTSSASRARERADAKHSAASNDCSRALSTPPSKARPY